jgi:cell fate (sporulation/competence/biofilm development) regulator YlbF (YheA/YmcA/DUF963 family)
MMTKQEAQQLLQKCVDLRQEIEDIQMSGSGEVWCEQDREAIWAAQDVTLHGPEDRSAVEPI